MNSEERIQCGNCGRVQVLTVRECARLAAFGQIRIRCAACDAWQWLEWRTGLKGMTMTYKTEPVNDASETQRRDHQTTLQRKAKS